MKALNTFIAASFSVLLAACGGGDGDTSGTGSAAPVFNQGDGQNDNNNSSGGDSGGSSGGDSGGGDGSSGGDSSGGDSGGDSGSSGGDNSSGGSPDAPGENGSPPSGSDPEPPSSEEPAPAPARFDTPTAMKSDGDGNLYVVDSGNQAVRRVTPNGQVSTLAIDFPQGSKMEVDASGNVFVLNGTDFQIRRITPSGQVSVLQGSYMAGTDIVVNAAGELFATASSDIYRFAADGTRSLIVSLPVGYGMYGGMSSSGLATDMEGALYALYPGRRPGVLRIAPDGTYREVFVGGSFVALFELVGDGKGNLTIGTQGPPDEMRGVLIVPRAAQPAIQTNTGTHTVSLYDNGVHRRAFDDAGNVVVVNASYQAASDANCASCLTLENIRVVRIALDGTETILYSGLPGGETVSREAVENRIVPGIALGDGGAVFFTDPTTHAVYKVESNGEASLFAGAAGVAGNAN